MPANTRIIWRLGHIETKAGIVIGEKAAIVKYYHTIGRISQQPHVAVEVGIDNIGAGEGKVEPSRYSQATRKKRLNYWA